jgi:hypothetical protein
MGQLPVIGSRYGYCRDSMVTDEFRIRFRYIAHLCTLCEDQLPGERRALCLNENL